MNEVLLVLTLYCGVPVSATLAYKENGDAVVRAYSITLEKRRAFLELEANLKHAGAQVARVNVEDQVGGLRCPVST